MGKRATMASRSRFLPPIQLMKLFMGVHLL